MCGAAASTSRPPYPYLAHRRPDGRVDYRSLRGLHYQIGQNGITVGQETIPWSAGLFAIYTPTVTVSLS